MPKYKHLHIIDKVINTSYLLHPLNDKNKNNLRNKEFFINRFQKDVPCAKEFKDISDNNNLFSFNIKNEQFNIFIEHTDAGGRDISFNKPYQKVGIPFAQKTFRSLIKRMDKVLVVDMYYELKTQGGNLVPDKERYCYLIVTPSEIYSAKPTYDILIGGNASNQSSRWVTLQEIQKCIGTKQTLMNDNENVWLVHPSNLENFLRSVVIDDYKNQFKDAYFKLLDLTHNKNSEEKKNIKKSNEIRKQLRLQILSRKQCEIYGCRVDNPQCLVASHIWPVNKIIHNKSIKWENKFKFIGDPNNAFLLCGTHDKLFDKLLITFNNNGTVVPSKLIKNSTEAYGLGKPNQRIILIKKENIPYLEKHRELFYEAEEGRVLL